MDEPQSATKRGPSRKKGGKAKDTGNHDAKETKEVKEVELFSEEFNKKIDEFKGFYREYLNLRSITGTVDPEQEYRKVSEDVKDKIQKACLRVLKNDVHDAENWIETQQKEIREQVTNVDKAEADTRKALEAAKNFSAAEIDQHVAIFKNKRMALETSLSELEAIKARAGDIYNKGDNSID